MRSEFTFVIEMNMVDDPFACFGEDETDEESPSAQGEEQHVKVKVLVNHANMRFLCPAASECNDIKSTQTVIANTISSCDDPWQYQSPPLYQNPALILANVSTNGVGGGRGYVAGNDLMPGTLLLVETPVSTWDRFHSTETVLGIELLHFILFYKNDSRKTHKLIHNMAMLHPTKVHVDHYYSNCHSCSALETDQFQIIDMMKAALDKYSTHPLMDEILVSIPQLLPVDICRMILALRYNSFESGLYLHFSMFNHSESSNCIKYMPSSSHSRKHSEVRTTRHVQKGEALTLHYIPPHREVSHATRRHYLWHQHRFDIGDIHQIPLQIQNMELISTALNQHPPSHTENLDETTVTFQLEKSIVQLEDEWEKLGSNSRYNSLINLEKHVSSIISQALKNIGNPHHILLLRLYRLHVDLVDSVLKQHTQMDILVRFIQSAESLLRLEIRAWGPHHPDIARTHQDMANAISFILSTSHKDFFQFQIPGLSSFVECSRKEAFHRSEYHRIRLLYPHDVEQYL